jgi:hypothetical protein
MNESSPISPSLHSNYHIQQQQQQQQQTQYRSDASSNYDPYRQHTQMDYNNDLV